MVVILMAIIERPELDVALKAKWLLLYGRRKTGKTFYVREKSKYARYFIVTRGSELIDVGNGERMTLNEFMKFLPLLLQTGRIVIDEFHRLGEPFFSLLQGLSGKGELTLITSTRHYFKRFLGESSPLLGLFHAHEVGLVRPSDALSFVRSLGFEGKSLVELAVLVQEPWLAPTVESYGVETFDVIGTVLKDYVPGLVGEIFTEEERELTKRYWAILEAVADGKVSTGEIAGELSSRGLMENAFPGAVAPYLETLVGMGLLERLPVSGKRRKVYRYRHVSPLVDFAYYLNAKYGFFETGLPQKTVRRLLEETLPRYVEVFFERLLAQHYGLQPVRIEKPELELDVALVKNRRFYLVAEVKWKEKLREWDIRKAENKFESAGAEVNLLIVPDKSVLPREPENARVFDWMDALALTP
ncbi:ATP-binding protein [Thermococcus sp. 21S7]|uniref:ATP-binding protein n=1 Tax=Thermococcus sp. 21S7 TaxID=1638221 RepID=UPI001F119371|nr:ATP-binding protein [Thermococcus sp. 21S7]